MSVDRRRILMGFDFRLSKETYLRIVCFSFEVDSNACLCLDDIVMQRNCELLCRRLLGNIGLPKALGPAREFRILYRRFVYPGMHLILANLSK